jgi:hypothetical protein
MKTNPAQSSPDKNDPALQGEGNYTATRRHRESVEQFVQSGKVDEAAHDAAPQDPTEEREMQQAEEAGRERARK